mmetsp:Transcript_597/g.1460  ORF Transcript_597/g.1460 Transcript_597/m.1460 type:complete len:292 (+) Transcript_597:492-1367(+)
MRIPAAAAARPVSAACVLQLHVWVHLRDLAHLTTHIFGPQGHCTDGHGHARLRPALAHRAEAFRHPPKVPLIAASAAELLALVDGPPQRCGSSLPIPKPEVKSPGLEEAAVWADDAANALSRLLARAWLRWENHARYHVVPVHVVVRPCSVPFHLVLTPDADVAITVPVVALEPLLGLGIGPLLAAEARGLRRAPETRGILRLVCRPVLLNVVPGELPSGAAAVLRVGRKRVLLSIRGGCCLPGPEVEPTRACQGPAAVHDPGCSRPLRGRWGWAPKPCLREKPPSLGVDA